MAKIDEKISKKFVNVCKISAGVLNSRCVCWVRHTRVVKETIWHSANVASNVIKSEGDKMRKPIKIHIFDWMNHHQIESPFASFQSNFHWKPEKKGSKCGFDDKSNVLRKRRTDYMCIIGVVSVFHHILSILQTNITRSFCESLAIDFAIHLKLKTPNKRKRNLPSANGSKVVKFWMDDIRWTNNLTGKINWLFSLRGWIENVCSCRVY